MTDRTVTSIAVLEQQCAAVRAAGWASAYEEMMLGINGVAVPVFDETGDCVASLAIVGSIQFVQEQPDDALLATLIASGAAMSAARSEERRVGEECVGTCRARRSPCHLRKKQYKQH